MNTDGSNKQKIEGLHSFMVKYNPATRRAAYLTQQPDNKLLLYDWDKKTTVVLLEQGDIKGLLYTSEGKPRLSIISIAHLNDSERMFFVTIFLGELLAWMRSQPGTGSLRALFYMDEVYGYFHRLPSRRLSHRC